MKKENNNDLWNHIKSIDIFSDKKHLHDFNFISANLRKLLPNKSFNDHIDIAKCCGFNQILAAQDQFNYDLIKKTTLPEFNYNNKIIVTFHYSSYRLLNSLLIANNIPFKVVADNNYLKNQGEKTISAYNQIASELHAKKFDFEIINAEDKTILLKCMKAIKNGYSLVFYADGNSGVGGMTKNKTNMVKIPFLNDSIYVRKGIAVLASLLKKNIVTITIDRDINKDQVNKIVISEEIPYPINRKDDNEVLKSIKAIFLGLENQLIKNPGLWEGWFYYHNFIDFENDNNDYSGYKKSETLFNHFDYGIGIMADKFYYVLNKKTLRIIPISKDVFDMLLQIILKNKIDKRSPLVDLLISENLINL